MSYFFCPHFYARNQDEKVKLEIISIFRIMSQKTHYFGFLVTKAAVIDQSTGIVFS